MSVKSSPYSDVLDLIERGREFERHRVQIDRVFGDKDRGPGRWFYQDCLLAMCDVPV